MVSGVVLRFANDYSITLTPRGARPLIPAQEKELAVLAQGNSQGGGAGLAHPKRSQLRTHLSRYS
jgi:hypothetical protein